MWRTHYCRTNPNIGAPIVSSPAATTAGEGGATTPQAQATTSVEGTWNDYNAAGAFSFQYPIELYSVQTGPANSQALAPGVVEVVPNDSTNLTPDASTYKISVAVHENTNGLTMDNQAELLASGGILLQYDPALLDSSHPIQDYTIDGIPALRVDNLPAGQAGTVTQIIAIHNDKIYEWVIEPAQVDGGTSNLPVVEQILNSFELAA